MCQEDGSPSPEAQAPTIIEKDDKGVSERVSDFLISLVDTLLRAVKQRDKLTASQLVDLPTDTFF